MQLFVLDLPFETALPMLQSMAAAIRPMIGVAMAGVFVMVFKPLLEGLLRAALLLLAPRKSLPERRRSQAMAGVRLLHRMAGEVESSQPAMAAELRAMAARD